jgi:hypothetical protein
LSQRIVEAEGELSRQASWVDQLQSSGRPFEQAEEALQAKRKRLASLRTSCKIIRRHIARRMQEVRPAASVMSAGAGQHQLQSIA